jgi:hypothetical protein
VVVEYLLRATHVEVGNDHQDIGPGVVHEGRR